MTCLRAGRSMAAIGVAGNVISQYRILETLDGGKGVAG